MSSTVRVTVFSPDVLHLMVFPSITPPSVSICGLPKMVVSNGMGQLTRPLPGRLRSDTACAVYS